MDWTKTKSAIALLSTAMVVASFFVGGYISTGNWNPWGNRHYYQILNANFQECHTLDGVSSCTNEHNVIFNNGATYVEQLLLKGVVSPGCTPIGAACSFNFIAMSNNTVAPTAGMASTGATNGDCGNAGTQAGTEYYGTSGQAHGMAAAAGTVGTDISGNTPQTETVVFTFTAVGSTPVAQSCLVNQSARGSANRVILAAATFTSITLANSDTIQITWSIQFSWT